MKRAASIVLLALLATAVVGETNQKRSEITVDSVILAMNDYRLEKNLQPLFAENRLMQAAEDRMRDMEDLGYWSHHSPDGRSPFFWLKFRSYRFTRAGENLARGFESTGLLVDSWMDSPGHRENILGIEFDHVGVSVIDGGTTGRYPGKSVVVLFGRE